MGRGEAFSTALGPQAKLQEPPPACLFSFTNVPILALFLAHSKGLFSLGPSLDLFIQ